MLFQGLKKYPVKEAVLHCASVPGHWYVKKSDAEIVAEVRRWHMEERGWRDIGYHFLVMPNGAEMVGRPADQIGAGVIGHNQGVLHILMIEHGTITHMGKFSDWFYEAQKKTVRRIVYRYGIPKVTGHNDYARKLCPGFKVRSAEFAMWPS